MTTASRSSPLYPVHVILALATGVVLCICAALLLLDSPSGLFDTGRWIDDPAVKYTLALSTAAFAAGAVQYLNRAALLGRRARIALVAAAPGLVGAAWVCLFIALMIHPIGF